MQEEQANKATMAGGIAVMALLFLVTGALGILSVAKNGIASAAGGAPSDPWIGEELWIEGPLATDGMTTWSQSEVEGKYLIVVFFDMQIASRQASMPVNALVRLTEERSDVAIVGIGLTESPDEAAMGGQMIGLMHPVIWDMPDQDGYSYRSSLEIQTVPNTWVLSPEGVVLRSNLHPDQAREYLKTLLP